MRISLVFFDDLRLLLRWEVGGGGGRIVYRQDRFSKAEEFLGAKNTKKFIFPLTFVPTAVRYTKCSRGDTQCCHWVDEQGHEERLEEVTWKRGEVFTERPLQLASRCPQRP